MKLVIEVNKEDYKRYKEDKICSYASAVLDAVPLNEVLDKIRAEIEKPLHDERCFDTADAKAQYIALNWCIEIIDKYREGKL